MLVPAPVRKTTDSNGNDILIRTMQDGQYEITAGSIDGLISALFDDECGMNFLFFSFLKKDIIKKI